MDVRVFTHISVQSSFVRVCHAPPINRHSHTVHKRARVRTYLDALLHRLEVVLQVPVLRLL